MVGKARNITGVRGEESFLKGPKGQTGGPGQPLLYWTQFHKSTRLYATLTFSLHFHEAALSRQDHRGAPRTRLQGRTTTTFTGVPRAADPLPEPADDMAAPEEHDSPSEDPQPAVEEETKTFKDLVRGDDAGFFLHC